MAQVFDWLTNYLAGKLGNVYNAATQGKVGDCIGGNGVECGVDIGIPWGSPVGSPTSGRVVAISSADAGNSIGYVVQIQAPNGDLWHFQHLMSLPTNVRGGPLQVGQNVSLGDVIGYSGGCRPNAYSGSTTRCADGSVGDPNSGGPHIEVRLAHSYVSSAGIWSQPWVDPRSTLNRLAPTILAQPGWNTQANVATPGQQSLGVNVSAAPCADLSAQYAQQIQGADAGTAAILQLQEFFAVAGCQLQQAAVNWGEHIAVFSLALLLIILGIYLVAEKQVNQVAGKVIM